MDQLEVLVVIGALAVALLIVVSSMIVHSPEATAACSTAVSTVETYTKFCWNCFLKPHTSTRRAGQQDALESFYKAQARIYDATRVRLLCGREDMLALVAAQIQQRKTKDCASDKPVWVDVGGGTGYNIEQMAKFVDVTNFFSMVYLVDLSPSLCSVARDRFERLGWKNVKVICEDARSFKLDRQHSSAGETLLDEKRSTQRADLITMSYSLSMIPDYYSVLDSLSALLTENGIIGVADFYVQSEIDYQSRNYIGGEINRHCMWISRVFWRTWFEADRVSLEAARRDYLEYRFGTVLSFNERCHLFGFRIPYYVWVGCPKESQSSEHQLAELNAAVTESPFLSAIDARNLKSGSSAIDIRSKSYESAIINLASCLPLPPSWYQAHHWRVHYDEMLEKHRQFRNEYIYAFTWEDSHVDSKVLKLNSEDVVLAITSAGDNILSYALEGPKRIHAVDLNPNQNHLLELKLAAFSSLPHEDVWALFGSGRHANFRQILLTKLSPHLSSLAFQYWLQHGPATFSPSGKGLYHTGGSRHALKLVAWLFRLLGIKDEVHLLCQAPTLAEQREIWKRSIRRVLLSKLLSWCVVSNKKWLWKALGVPNAQREMIERDFNLAEAAGLDPQPGVSPYLAPIQPSPSLSPRATSSESAISYQQQLRSHQSIHHYGTGRAIWAYAVATLDPVINNTLLSNSNHYYLLCLLGNYLKNCCPDYLTSRAHAKLSKPQAFDGLRIHTDELVEVVERMTPGTLTVAVLMDSLDWFDAPSNSAINGKEGNAGGSVALRRQIQLLRKAMKVGGRVLLRSAGQFPWYMQLFEEQGFRIKQVSVRTRGACIDRVNMYASTWLCFKLPSTPAPNAPAAHARATSLAELSIGDASLPY